MNLTESLSTHTALCEEIYGLMIQENRHLRNAGNPPPDTMLSKKSVLLGTLSFSLERIRAAIAEAFPTSAEIRSCVQKAQQTILKALLLDRENEQLLLKCTMQRRSLPPSVRPPASQLQKAYGRASEQ